MVNTQSLVGKVWEYGKQDCYTVVQNYYALLGITLPDFKRPANLFQTESIFLRHAVELGFRQIDLDCRRDGDLLVMRIGTKTPMHGAVYLSSDRILHQRPNSLSAIEPFGRYYRHRATAVFRHATCDAWR